MTIKLPISLLSLTFWSAAVSGAIAQDPTARTAIDGTNPAVRASIETAVCGYIAGAAATTDGVVVGEGPTYRIALDDRGMTFEPALADGPATDRSVRFELTTVARRDAPGRGLSTAPATPSLSTDRTSLSAARPGYTEIYDLLDAGVEQSFVFDELPAGSGDLVVRGRIRSSAPASQSAPDRIEFGADTDLGVTLSKVVGFDAAGRRVRGAMQLRGDEIELSLPAAFVDTATLPLTLDPLIGTRSVLPLGWNDSDPDIAYDASADVYLVVWQRIGIGIRGLYLDEDLQQVGSVFSIRSNNRAFSPRVANVNRTNAFGVVWGEAGEVMGSIFSAHTGLQVGVGPRIVAGGSGDQTTPDIGGDSSGVGNTAIVTWWNATLNRIEATRWQLDSTTRVWSRIAITGPGHDDSFPTISKSGGTTGDHLITWQRAGTNGSTIRAARVDRLLAVLDSDIPVVTSAGHHTRPEVDGDGTSWVVAWASETMPRSGDRDVVCRGFRTDVASRMVLPTTGYVDVEADAGDDERAPSVSWLGESVLVGFEDHVSSGRYHAFVRSIDPLSCTRCEGEVPLLLGAADEAFVRVASTFHGRATTARYGNADALIVWSERDLATNDRDLLAVAFRADDGDFVEMAGGCGDGGRATADCAVVGHGDFTARVREARPYSSAALLLGAGNVYVPCGSCVLRSSAEIVINTVTGNGGQAAASLPIPQDPALRGAGATLQWVLPNGSGCFGFDLSTALRVTIE